MIDIKTFLLTLVAALALGLTSGYWLHGRLDKGKQADQLLRERKDSANNVVEGIENSQRIENKVRQSNTAADATSQAALARVNAQLERKNDELQKRVSALELDAATKDALLELCADPRLDAGTVRLLNDQRRASLEPARSSDGAGQAAPHPPGP